MEKDEILGGEGYIPHTLLREIKSKKTQVTISFLLDPHMGTMAKRFAVSFYKELRRLGFTEEQIADFSTELLIFLNEKLEAYKNRLQQKAEYKED